MDKAREAQLFPVAIVCSWLVSFISGLLSGFNLILVWSTVGGMVKACRQIEKVWRVESEGDI